MHERCIIIIKACIIQHNNILYPWSIDSGHRKRVLYKEHHNTSSAEKAARGMTYYTHITLFNQMGRWFRDLLQTSETKTGVDNNNDIVRYIFAAITIGNQLDVIIYYLLQWSSTGGAIKMGRDRSALSIVQDINILKL